MTEQTDFSRREFLKGLLRGVGVVGLAAAGIAITTRQEDPPKKDERYSGQAQELYPTEADPYLRRTQKTYKLNNPQDFAACSMFYYDRGNSRVDNTTKTFFVVVNEPHPERSDWNKLFMFRQSGGPIMLDTAEIYVSQIGAGRVWYIPEEGANVTGTGEKAFAAPDNYPGQSSHVSKNSLTFSTKLRTIGL